MIPTRVLDWLNRHGKAVACRGMHLRGYGRVHPKHIAPGPVSRWYLAYIGPDDHVLDLGCGLGYHAEAAATVARWVLGLDANAEYICRARARAGGHWPFLTAGAYFAVHDLRLPIPCVAGAYSVVLALDILEHLDARGAALREMHRALADGGRLLLVVPNRGTRWRARLRAAGLFAYSDPDHRTEYLLPELVTELVGAGFRLAGAPRPLVYDTPWAGLIDCTATVSLALYRRLSRWRVEAASRAPSETVGWAIVAERT